MKSNKNGDVYVDSIYEKIKNENDKHKIAEVLDGFFYDASNVKFSEKKYMKGFKYENMKKFTPLIVGITQTLKEKCFWERKTSEEFYNELWNSIKNNEILSTNESKIYALWLIAYREKLPYREFDFVPLKFNSDISQKIIEKNEEIIKRIMYIQSINFSQKTEMASLILNEILTLDDFDDQVHIFLLTMQLMLKKEERRIKIKEIYGK